VWSGPAWLLAHSSSWQTAVIAALTSVVCNNLPAASLLAARPPVDPHALLVGLNLGPNLAVTGALSAVLWLQVSRAAGCRPSVGRFTRLGLVVVPVSMAAALGALALAH
jgi:arsenical pump membrane protein